MYTPDAFKLDDPEIIRAAMAANPFACFASNGPKGPEITQLPLVLCDEAEGPVIYGHFARANPHWKALDGTAHAVAVFSGAQGYVSPNYYATKQETGKVVPTWNYVTVHARGIPQILEAEGEARHVIDILTDTMEQPRADGWKVADAPAAYTKSMIRGIVAFRMDVTELSAKAKLSQNREAKDIEGTISGLTQDGVTDLAESMRLASL